MINLIFGVRNRHVFLLDLLALLFIPALALTLRMDRMDWWPDMGRATVFYTLVAVAVNLRPRAGLGDGPADGVDGVLVPGHRGHLAEPAR